MIKKNLAIEIIENEIRLLFISESWRKSILFPKQTMFYLSIQRNKSTQKFIFGTYKSIYTTIVNTTADLIRNMFTRYDI